MYPYFGEHQGPVEVDICSHKGFYSNWYWAYELKTSPTTSNRFVCVCSVILILLLGHCHGMYFRFLVESTCVTYACAKLVSWMWTGVTTLETLQSPENKIQPDFYTDKISDLLAVKKVASAWWWCLQDWWTWLHSLILMWIISTLWCWTWKHITSDASCGEKIDN